jgi:hypothetical protein
MDTSSRPLEIDSDLLLTSPEGANIRVRSNGKRLDVDLDPRLLGSKTRRELPTRSTRGKRLAMLQRLLRRGDLSLAVSVRGILIAELDGKGEGTWSAKVLGLAPMRLHLRGLLTALSLWVRRS